MSPKSTGMYKTLTEEIAHYLALRKDEIDKIHYGSITIVIQDGHFFKATISKDEKRGKEVVFSED